MINIKKYIGIRELVILLSCSLLLLFTLNLLKSTTSNKTV